MQQYYCESEIKYEYVQTQICNTRLSHYLLHAHNLDRVRSLLCVPTYLSCSKFIQSKIIIRECSSALYVGLVHAAPFTQYIAFLAFSTNWLTEGSTSRYTCKDERISRPG